MFLLFGTRASADILAIVTFVCSNCGVSAAQRVMKYVTKFTLFFVPLFPVSTRYAVDCSHCGFTTALSREQAERSIAYATGSQQGPAEL